MTARIPGFKKGFVAAVALAGLALGIFLMRRHPSENSNALGRLDQGGDTIRRANPPPPVAQQSAKGAGDPASPITFDEAATAKFRGLLTRFKAVKARADEAHRRYHSSEDGKRAEAAAHFGHQQVVAVGNRYEALSPDFRKYCDQHREDVSRLTELEKAALLPALVAEFQSSDLRIGETTLGALVTDLLASTDYADSFRKQLVRASDRVLNTPAVSAQIAEAEDLEALLSLARNAAPELRKRYISEMERVFPSKEFRAYSSDLASATAIEQVTKLYRASHQGETRPLDRERERLFFEMQAILETMPRDSESRVHLAQSLADEISQRPNPK